MAERVGQIEIAPSVALGRRLRLVGFLCVSAALHSCLPARGQNSLPRDSSGALLAVGGQKSAPVSDARLAAFDFRKPETIGEWAIEKDIARKSATPDGMRLDLAGDDPILVGPPRDYPPGVPLFLHIWMKSDHPGSGQIYYFDDHASEKHSVRFSAPAGGVREIVVPLPPLGPKFRMRFDPQGTRGTVIVERIEIRPRPKIESPKWMTPTPPKLDSRNEHILQSGKMSLHHGATWGSFEVRNPEVIAVGHNRQQLGFQRDGKTIWLDLSKQKVEVEFNRESLTVRFSLRDPYGATWNVEQAFKIAKATGFEVTTTFRVDRDRDVVHLPFVILMPGLGTHGKAKTQALFPGLEYLDNEPSSSQADIEGPGAIRRVPDMSKVTIPFMAISHSGKYVGLAWRPDATIAALFDSPGRVWNSAGHLLALIAPGGEGDYRNENELLPFRPMQLKANQPISAKATILLGEGGVDAAVRDYVAQAGLPAPPALPTLQSYVRLAAAGWLDSGLREGDLYRHAVGVGFGPGPAGDAAWMMEQLACLTDDAALANRLHAASKAALARVSPGSEYFANVGHLKHPLAGFVFDRIAPTVAQARQQFSGSIGQFDPDGVARYHPPKNGLNFARTNPTTEASGLAALPVAQLLESIVYTGDMQRLPEAIRFLDRLARYDNAVPRGAQTWEVPLHTPDILASAHMVKAFTLGFELTQKEEYRKRAIRWGWTGVPFVYLRDSTDGPIGRFATTAVFGATHWQAPNWMGLPVQWCGLVYADALRRLERIDPGGPWKKIADGIVASAIEQTYPLEHPRRGLLPDSFSLRSQTRNAADINPGTLQPLAIALLTGVPDYDYSVSPSIVAPGKLEILDKETRRFRFTGWSNGPQRILLHFKPGSARVTVDGKLTAGIRLVPLAEGNSTVLEVSVGQKPIEVSFDGR